MFADWHPLHMICMLILGTFLIIAFAYLFKSVNRLDLILRANAPDDIEDDDTAGLLDEAWGIIANAGGGDWTKESEEWQRAAERWRARYFKDTGVKFDAPENPQHVVSASTEPWPPIPGPLSARDDDTTRGPRPPV